MAVWIPVVVVIIIALFNIAAYLANENNLIARTCLKGRYQGLLLVTNRKPNHAKTTRPHTFLAWDLLDPSSLVRFHACTVYAVSNVTVSCQELVVGVWVRHQTVSDGASTRTDACTPPL